MKIGVLSVQGAVSEHLHQLELCNIEALAVKSADTLKDVSGLIIPGGESTTIGKLIAAFGLAKPIIERVKEKKLALFGTCAGMILMAKKITGGTGDQTVLDLMDISVQRNAFGRQKESFETDLAFSTFDYPLRAVFIRAPIIKRTGPTVEIMAEMAEGIVAARQDNLLVTSFHPELTDDLRVHHCFIEMCKMLQ